MERVDLGLHTYNDKSTANILAIYIYYFHLE